MKTHALVVIALAALVFIAGCSSAKPPLVGGDPARLRELDAYWAEVSRAVREGDFEAYKATCHEQGVLVSGVRRTCQPLAQALARWEQDFVNTRTGKKKGNVEFRFSQRLGDGTTAHETGIFLYSTVDAEGQRTEEFIHFEGLLIKEKGRWTILMEYQKSKAAPEEWKALDQESRPDKDSTS